MFALVEWSKLKEHPHRVAFFSVLVPELCCLLLSTAYHLFMAQVKHYEFWLKFDVRTHRFAAAWVVLHVAWFSRNHVLAVLCYKVHTPMQEL